MRRTWARGEIWRWLAVAAALGGWRCAVDDRSPNEVASEKPAGDSTDTARFSQMPTGGAGGSGPASSTGMGSGGTSGMAGSGRAGGGTAGGAGSGMTGSEAGSAGMTAPPDSGGAPPGGDLPDDPFGGLGDFGDPGGTTSSSNSCPGFDACGGTLDGTWTYSDVCIEPSANSADLLQDVCPTASVMYEPGGTATLTFTGSSVSRSGIPVGDSVITFPADCLEGLGCSFLADESTECTEMSGNCICRAASSIDWGTQSYTVNGGQLSLGDGRSFDYCVQGNTLTYLETGDAQEAGTHTLQRN